MFQLIEEYEIWGLKVNIQKTKYLCVGGEASDLTMNDGKIITHCQNYNYLGVIFDSTGTDNHEIERRITTAKKAISCLNGILWNKNITKRRKFNIYETLVKSSLLYGSENWRLTEKYKRKLEAVEMDAMRRSLRISRRERIRNETVKEMMGIEGTLMDDIEKRQLIWYGHIQRMSETRLPKQVMNWQPAERRKRGRPKTSWKQGVVKAMSTRNLQELDWEDRRRWRQGVGQRRKTF
ncbi:uncharacterized protein LOC123317755 [Coccinella septempunctata]|uniref:uncharacterized protein LOC123317755 n=2 Tax=Coccinella septempunctata TaxID=41139 RepID=UPI001D07D82E|nr:uncharacterized protein LOC123317755 [Coccinella septempunctata]